MAAAAPTVPSHAGAVKVDYRSPFRLRKSTIAAATPGALTTISRPATGTGVSEWANSARFATGNGNQDQLAQSSTEGHLAAVSFSGVDFGLSDLSTVYRVNLELPFMGRWQLTPPLASPGEIAVRCIVAWDEEEIYEGLFRLDPVGPQVTSPAPATPVPVNQIHEMASRWGAHGSAAQGLTEALEEILGYPLTIGALEGVGSSLRILLSSWVGQEAFSPQWLAGPLRMVVRYRNPPDPTQTSAQFRIGLPGMGTILYDSGKLVGELGDHHVAAALVPSGWTPGDDLSADAQVWDESDVGSGFGTEATFSTLTATEASLIHDPGDVDLAIDWYPAIVVPAARWRRNSEVSGGSQPNVWQCRLARDEQPWIDFSIAGVEEDPIVGVNWLSTDPAPPTVFQAYTEYDLTFDGLGTLNTDPDGKAAFIWDEEGTLASSNGEPTLYMRPSDGRWMAGWRGAAVIIRVRKCLATRHLVWAGRNWDGRILQWPAITRKADDLLSGIISAPAGDLVLSDHDGAMRELIAHGQFPTDGWLTDGRPIEIRVMRPDSEYDDAPVVVEGITRWPEGADILSDGKATFRILPLELSPERAEIGRDVYDQKVYPNLRESDKNKPIPEVLGLDAGGYYPAAVVDRGPNKGGGTTTTFRGVKSSPTLLQFLLAGVPVNPAYYTYASGHIYANAAAGGAQAFFDSNIDGEWQVRHAGEGSLLGYTTCGYVARSLVAKTGIPYANTEAAQFAAFSAPCQLLVQGPTKILTLLHRVQRSGFFRVVQRLDRQWVAVPDAPEYLDVGIVIDDYAVLGRPGWRLRKELMGATLDVSYPAAANTAADQRRSWPARTYRSSSQYGMQTAVKVELDTASPAIFERYAAMLETPIKEVSIRTDRRALYAYPGTPVALNLNRALAPGGVETWALCSVEEWRQPGPSAVDLDLRFARTLVEAER